MGGNALLSSKIEAGVVLSAWSETEDHFIIEAFSQSDFSAVMLDMQHGSNTEKAALINIGIILAQGKSPIVRIPVDRFDVASHMLDFGAQAVIAPMINSVEDARRFADAMKYPPLGKRSWGPSRSPASYGNPASKEFLQNSNKNNLSFAMIETRAAFDALDDILAVEGIDGIFVGPSDFAIGWSNGQSVDCKADELSAVFAQIAKKANQAGKIAGIFSPDTDFARERIEQGYRFVTVGTDMMFLRSAIADNLKKLKNS